MKDKLTDYFFNFLPEKEKIELFKELEQNDSLRTAFTEEVHALSLISMQTKEGDDRYAQYKLNQFRRKTQIIYLKKTAHQLIKYAAIMLISVGLWTLYHSISENNRRSAELTHFEVPNGQRARISLPDGTQVWLNAGSVLSYSANFSSRHREVQLDGEGYFEVKTDEKNPFIVKTSLMAIRVLGTRFNVKSYLEEMAFVSLMEGKIEITTRDKKEKRILSPDQQVSVSKETGITLLQQMGIETKNSWLEGKHSYVNEPLSVIVKDLERRFNTPVIIRDKEMENELFSLHADDKTTLEQIMNRLKATKELDYEINEEQIEIVKPLNQQPMK